MPVYRLHRLKETARQQFRWAPHTLGLSTVRAKDYEAASSVEARTPYAAWLELKDSADALQPGDILESDCGDLRIYKFVGFEQAQWLVIETKPEIPGSVPTSGSATEEAVR
ncbi:MAG: hypothetical protein H7039_09080 [Bryobacteraceae bacterium]|nr:hypothetical protein [Bryobacteraceae bacterium]